MSLNTDKNSLISKILDGSFSCIVERDGNIIFTSSERGISPLIDINDFQKDTLNGSRLYDKIIGRAAALIAVRCKAKFVYGSVMSSDAFSILEENNIEACFTEKVPMIENRDKTGMCPIEQSVQGIDDPDEAVIAIRNKVNFLKS